MDQPASLEQFRASFSVCVSFLFLKGVFIGFRMPKSPQN
ncbi:hypothetical protein F383_37282 [Gossypium arboreum]|uniref:Uncharacterized protein n=1 Tax=Gossypium arboreum TaxID=29729 RepID=A0A0B0MC79_GOSAR|nr:hypothetical protein F383_37282 [Gossypium arboreum]